MFAMGMIDENFFQVGFNSLVPTFGGRALQVEHRESRIGK
jgi:hypothetical protein